MDNECLEMNYEFDSLILYYCIRISVDKLAGFSKIISAWKTCDETLLN